MKRTTSIMIAFALLAMQALLLIPAISGAMVSTTVGVGSRLMCALLGASLIASVIGFWQMKKQGLYAYIIYTVLSQLFFMSMNSARNSKSLIFSIVIIILGASSFDKME